MGNCKTPQLIDGVEVLIEAPLQIHFRIISTHNINQLYQIPKWIIEILFFTIFWVTRKLKVIYVSVYKALDYTI